MVEVKQRGSANETKEEIQGQEEEVEEDKDVSSDEGLPIYQDFEFEYAVKYEIENLAMRSRRGCDQVPGGPGADHGGSEAKGQRQ